MIEAWGFHVNLSLEPTDDFSTNSTIKSKHSSDIFQFQNFKETWGFHEDLKYLIQNIYLGKKSVSKSVADCEPCVLVSTQFEFCQFCRYWIPFETKFDEW